MSYKKLSLIILLAIFATIRSELPAQIVKDGLVGYWSLDKTTIEGKKVKDIVNKFDGEIKGNPTIVEGKVKEALEFKSIGDYVEIPHNELLNFGVNDFTVCVWAKTSANTGRWAQRHDIVGKGDPSVSGYAISADSNKGFFWVGSVGEFSGVSNINDDKWHYIVGLRKASDCFIYIDGKLENKGTNSENVDTQLNLIFAKHPLKAESYFVGAIDEVCIYNRALTEAEILTNLNAKGASVDYIKKVSITWGMIKL